MRAAWIDHYGGADALEVVERPDPTPGPTEIVVDVAFAALNFPDLLFMQNKYQVSLPVPFTPGSEFAGFVSAVGDGVTRWKTGDRVYGSAMYGAFAEKVLTEEQRVNEVPEKATLQSAAAFGVVYNTSYHALRSIAEVQPGEWVVVLGASGGVGLSCVELAKLMGAKVLAAASSDAKCAVCLERGADAAINYETEDLKERIKQITGGGADVVMDPVGGRYSEQALRSTRWGGRFVTLGFAAGDIPRIPLNLVLLKGVIVRGFEIRTFGEHAPELQERDHAEVATMLADNRVVPYISASYPLERVAEAFRAVEARQITGKVLIEMTGKKAS